MTTHFKNHATSTSGPYDDERQARADVADIFEQALHSIHRGALAEASQVRLAEASQVRLADACERAGVTLGAYDARILLWLANYEPQMCAVIVGLVIRAHAAGRAAVDTGPLLDSYCEIGQHANCPGRLCQCPACQHWGSAWPTA